jgi:hypothetical protein
MGVTSSDSHLGVPSRRYSHPGLPHSKPAHHRLSYAAPRAIHPALFELRHTLKLRRTIPATLLLNVMRNPKLRRTLMSYAAPYRLRRTQSYASPLELRRTLGPCQSLHLFVTSKEFFRSVPHLQNL